MKYPYYIVPMLEEYRGLDPESAEAQRLRLLLEVNIGAPDVLERVLGYGDEKNIVGKNDEDVAINTDSSPTLDTITSFLDKFGKNQPPVGYMSEVVAGEANKEDSSAESLKEEALKNEDTQAETIEKTSKDEEEEIKRLMREKRWEAALKLIEAQNLINPQKSIYFAHQIRFLKKLIRIQNYRNTTKG